MSQGVIIALITAIGSIVGGIISSLITSHATLRAKDKESTSLWGSVIGGAVLGAISLLIALWLLGIFPPFDNKPPQLTDYGTLLYQDSFDNVAGDWSLAIKSSVKDGKLVIESGGVSSLSSASSYDDFVAEIIFQYHGSNPPTTYLNFYLRESICNNKLCGYQISVASDGTYGTSKYLDPDFVKIIQPIISYQINPDKPNILSVVVKGSIFKIYINRLFVGEFSDYTYTSGKFHLDADFGTVAIDEFKIYALP